MKKIHETRVSPACSVKIYKNTEYGEFVVKAVINGKVEGGKDGGAYESSKKDARGTAAAFVRNLRKRPACKKR